MKLSNKTYDVLKWLLFLAIPSLTAFIGGVADLYDYDATQIVTLIGLVGTFIGAITGVSNLGYNKEEK